MKLPTVRGYQILVLTVVCLSIVIIGSLLLLLRVNERIHEQSKRINAISTESFTERLKIKELELLNTKSSIHLSEIIKGLNHPEVLPEPESAPTPTGSKQTSGSITTELSTTTTSLLFGSTDTGDGINETEGIVLKTQNASAGGGAEKTPEEKIDSLLTVIDSLRKYIKVLEDRKFSTPCCCDDPASSEYLQVSLNGVQQNNLSILKSTKLENAETNFLDFSNLLYFDLTVIAFNNIDSPFQSQLELRIIDLNSESFFTKKIRHTEKPICSSGQAAIISGKSRVIVSEELNPNKVYRIEIHYGNQLLFKSKLLDKPMRKAKGKARWRRDQRFGKNMDSLPKN